MANYPIPAFHFSVSWGADNVGFSEVSGLSQEIQAIEYRRPIKSSPALEKIISAFREKISFNEADRFLHNDMMKAMEFMKEYDIDAI